MEEIPLLPGHHPYVVKTPWAYNFIRELLDSPKIHLDGALVPIRQLESSSFSRGVLEVQSMYRLQPNLLELEDDWISWGGTPGGVTYSLEPLDLERFLAHSFYKLIEALVKNEVPVYFISFPKFCNDIAYLFRVIKPILPSNLNEGEFRQLVLPVIQQNNVRVEQELNGYANQTDVKEKCPGLPHLHNSALKREVRRLNAELELLRGQLQNQGSNGSHP